MKPSVAVTWHRLRAVLTMACAALATGCGPQTPASAATSLHAYNLTLYGYNYTDTEIGSFEVNGQGGGNVAVSSPGGGGGASVCCVTVYSSMAEPQNVSIKWSRDGDTWCEQSVPIMPAMPAKPEYLEVHFYRDGHIELAVTETLSLPRFQLERVHGNSRFADSTKNVNNDSKFGRCKLGYR